MDIREGLLLFFFLPKVLFPRADTLILTPPFLSQNARSERPPSFPPLFPFFDEADPPPVGPIASSGYERDIGFPFLVFRAGRAGKVSGCLFVPFSEKIYRLADLISTGLPVTEHFEMCSPLLPQLDRWSPSPFKMRDFSLRAPFPITETLAFDIFPPFRSPPFRNEVEAFFAKKGGSI